MREKGYLFWGFSKNFSLRVEAPACIGMFCSEDARLRDALLAQGEAGSYEEGNKVIFSWLLDKKGCVLDALFTAFGDSALVGCAELICEKSIGKPYQKALRITRVELEAFLTDEKKEIPAKTRRVMSLVLEARDQLFTSLPLPPHQDPHPEWNTLSKEQKLILIQCAIEEYILPHLQRDGGGIEILDLIEGNKVRIRFQGACVDCMGSSGSTFAYIQHLLKQEVHQSLEVERLGIVQ